MNRDDILHRLFRAAAHDVQPAEMPFGFDTRILALARNSKFNGSIARLVQRIALAAIAVIVVASAAVYGSSTSDSDFSSEYAMADTAIAGNLGE